MSSGVTLVAAGRDNPLNIDPDFTFFSTVFKRHTNFSSVIDRLNINTKPSNNGSSTSRFEIKGDLLSYVYLVCESPEKFIVNRDWSQVIDKVELFIGNQLVDTQYYEYSKKIAPDVQASSLSRSVKGPDGLTSSYFYPFKFFFCEDWASTIPLIALNYHDVEVVIHWADDVYGQLEVQAYLNLFANYWNTYFEDIRSAVTAYQTVTISATDEYTDVQANVLLYQSNIADNPYSNMVANIVSYQNLTTPELNNLLTYIGVYQIDIYSFFYNETIIYQNVTIPDNNQYSNIQSNIVLYQAATTDLARIPLASDVVGGYSNLVPTPSSTEEIAYIINTRDNVFTINNEKQPILTMRINSVYKFSYSAYFDESSGHFFRFSATEDGTHNGGTEYTTGVSLDGSDYDISITVDPGAPDTLYYYCVNHAGMGGTINIKGEYDAPTYDLSNGYITYDGYTDSSQNFNASNTLDIFLTKTKNIPRSNASTNVLSTYDIVNASNILTQNIITGFLTYDGSTDNATNYDATNVMLSYTTQIGNEVRVSEASNVILGWDESNVIYNFPNTAPTYNATTGYLSYDGYTDDNSNYDASNSLNVFISYTIENTRDNKIDTIITEYNTFSFPYAAPTVNITTHYMDWLGDEDDGTNYPASSNLINYVSNLHYSEISNAAANVITAYTATGLTESLTADSTTGFLTYSTYSADSASDYPSSNALYDYMTVKHFEPRTIQAQQLVSTWNTANAVYSFSNTAPSFGSNGFILYDAIQDDGTQYDGSNSLVTFSNFEENVVRIVNATALVNGYSNLIIGISSPKAAPTYDEDTGFITFDGETDVAGSNVGSTALYTYVENYGQTILGYSFDLFTRYIYIDKDERRITADRSVDYVITQTQRIPASNKKEIELPLSHPVSFIASTASNFNDTNNMLLEINGEPIGDPKPAVPHYRHVSTYFHSPYGSNQNTTMMYPFCLDASKKEPSGSLNFSRLDSARIILDEAINGDIYAVNYNILRISNGVGGLLYA
jgi:hypothetical protein